MDLSFVPDLVSDCYCPNNLGPSWDALVLFKAVFLQSLYGLSDRQVEEQINLHLGCKWFVGLQPEEVAPDHTALCRFRARLQANGQRPGIMVKKNRGSPQVVGRADPESWGQRPSIERKSAEQKRCHGLRQVRYCGLAKVIIQVLIACMVVNCKPMAKLQEMGTGPPWGRWCPDAGGRR